MPFSASAEIYAPRTISFWYEKAACSTVTTRCAARATSYETGFDRQSLALEKNGDGIVFAKQDRTMNHGIWNDQDETATTRSMVDAERGVLRFLNT